MQVNIYIFYSSENSHVNIFMHYLTNLWCQFHFQLPCQVLSLKLCILPDIWRDHPLDLLSLEQQAQAKVIHSEKHTDVATQYYDKYQHREVWHFLKLNVHSLQINDLQVFLRQ